MIGFGTTSHRLQLMDGLKAALDCFKRAGCKRVYINGSFVTKKQIPNDIDVAWEPFGVDLHLLRVIEPIFFDFNNFREAQKEKFGCEFFPASINANRAGDTFLHFFQIDKNTGNQKGIIVIDL